MNSGSLALKPSLSHKHHKLNISNNNNKYQAYIVPTKS